MNVEDDRLSSLPDELIHKILSFISSKHVVETSVLSSRWRFIWTTMPYLNFSSEEYRTLPRFSKFVTKFLSGHRVEVYSVNLSFRGKICQAKRTIDYALFHNVQRLSVGWLLEKDIEFPLSIFCSQSLKHLSLKGIEKEWTSFILPISTWELPALTTLHLQNVALCADHNDLFFKCANLKSLTLTTCRVIGLNTIRICHPLLSNLALEDDFPGRMWNVNVTAPQLKNLTIRNWSRELLISAPNLASFLFNSDRALRLSTDGFHSLENVDLCITRQYQGDAHKIGRLLEQLCTVQFFTVNLEVVETLYSQVEIIADQPSPFSKLKSLKIYPAYVHGGTPIMPVEVKNYLLDGSPGATCTMFSREEIRAMGDAPKCMAELRALLESEKANTKRARMEDSKAPIECHKPKMHGQDVTQVDDERAQPGMKMQPLARMGSCLKDLTRQLWKGETKVRCINSKLQSIDGLLRNIPTSRRARMQECFDTLCAEAVTIIDKTIDDIKFQCDEKQRQVRGCFHELASASQMPT